MLISELITEIRWEAKLEKDSTWDSHLLLLIWDEMVQIASLQNEATLYVYNQILTNAAQNGGTLLVALPAMIKLDRVEYNSGANTWWLPDRDSTIPPVPIQGKPRAYELQQGTPPVYNLALISPQAMGTDTLAISYFKYPALPVGTDVINPISWIQPLKTNCIRRAQIFNASSSDLRAQLFAEILSKAEAVVQNSNSELVKLTSDKRTN